MLLASRNDISYFYTGISSSQCSQSDSDISEKSALQFIFTHIFPALSQHLGNYEDIQNFDFPLPTDPTGSKLPWSFSAALLWRRPAWTPSPRHGRPQNPQKFQPIQPIQPNEILLAIRPVVGVMAFGPHHATSHLANSWCSWYSCCYMQWEFSGWECWMFWLMTKDETRNWMQLKPV